MQLDVELVNWVEELTGSRVEQATRTYGGGSRHTWFVDLADGTATVLRVEPGDGAFSGTALSLEREAAVYRALQDTPVRIATLHGVEPNGRALLLERVNGTSDLRRLDHATTAAVLDDLMVAVAELHAVALDAVDGLCRPATPEDHALLDLDLWADLAGPHDRLDPEVVYAFAWLRANAPDRVARTVLVQGDTGPGNFVAAEGRVAALVDWEFAHFGDPMDDLAWVLSRAGDWPAERLLASYAAAGGAPVEHTALAYYAVFVQLRCAVTTARTIDRGGGAVGLAGYLVAHHRFLRRLTETLAAATGTALDRTEAPPTGDTALTWLYDRAIDDLAPLTADLPDPAAKLRARNAVTVLKHLRAVDRRGPTDAPDLDALREAAAKGGATGDAAVLRDLAGRAAAAAALWEQ